MTADLPRLDAWRPDLLLAAAGRARRGPRQHPAHRRHRGGLVTETNRPPLTDIAPYPTREEDATASAFIKHYAAFGLMHDRIAHQMLGDSRPQWRESLGHVMHSFVLVGLLREIRIRCGDGAADLIARDLWTTLQGGMLSPWLWEWADQEGLDHDAIAKVGDEVAARIKAKRAAGAEGAAR